MKKSVQINQSVYVVDAPPGKVAMYSLGKVIMIADHDTDNPKDGAFTVSIPNEAEDGRFPEYRDFLPNGVATHTPFCHVETDLLAVEKALLVESSTREALAALLAIKSICDPSDMVSRGGLNLWLIEMQHLIDSAKLAVSRIP